MDDALSAALRFARVSGQVLFDASYVAPWALDVPGSGELAPLLGLRGRAVAFHFARQGSFHVELDGVSQLVPEHHVIIVFGGGAHQIREGAPVQPLRLVEYLAGAPLGGRTGERTHLVCGALALEGAELSPFVGALPPVVCAPVGQLGVVEQLVEELDGGRSGSGYAISRLTELLCLAAIRAHVAAADVDQSWFRAATERELGRAMTALHGDPGRPWTVPALAREAGLSASRFSARFRQALGEPPMRYVTRLRMSEAGRLLRESDLRVAEVAARVGYDSSSSFSRIFRQHTGCSPRAWRAGGRGA